MRCRRSGRDKSYEQSKKEGRGPGRGGSRGGRGRGVAGRAEGKANERRGASAPSVFHFPGVSNNALTRFRRSAWNIRISFISYEIRISSPRVERFEFHGARKLRVHCAEEERRSGLRARLLEFIDCLPSSPESRKTGTASSARQCARVRGRGTGWGQGLTAAARAHGPRKEREEIGGWVEEEDEEEEEEEEEAPSLACVIRCCFCDTGDGIYSAINVIHNLGQCTATSLSEDASNCRAGRGAGRRAGRRVASLDVADSWRPRIPPADSPTTRKDARQLPRGRSFARIFSFSLFFLCLYRRGDSPQCRAELLTPTRRQGK
jgi:hypothetical protein